MPAHASPGDEIQLGDVAPLSASSLPAGASRCGSKHCDKAPAGRAGWRGRGQAGLAKAVQRSPQAGHNVRVPARSHRTHCGASMRPLCCGTVAGVQRSAQDRHSTMRSSSPGIPPWSSSCARAKILRPRPSPVSGSRPAWMSTTAPGGTPRSGRSRLSTTNWLTRPTPRPRIPIPRQPDRDAYPRHPDNGGGYAAPEISLSAAQDTGAAPPASRVADAIATATPTAPLTLGTSTPPNRRTARAGPAPAPPARDAQDRTNYKITITESLRFQGIAVLLAGQE